MKPFYKRAAPYLLAAAVLVPTLALLGIYQGGRIVMDSRQPGMAAGKSDASAQVGTRAERMCSIDITDYFLIGYLGLLGLALLARGARAHSRAPRRHDQPVLRQRPDGAGAQGPERAGGQPAQQRAACQRLRRPRPLLDLPHPHHRRLQRAARTVAARGLRARPGRRHAIPRSASPASCGRTTTCRSSSCSCRTRRRPMRMRRTRRGSARSAISSACSSTCAARPSWRRSGCRSTPCSSSTVFSARCRRR